jgi:valyl-tRNA synthetase
MPFITEEIWQSLPHDGESIMVSEYPKLIQVWISRMKKLKWSRLITAIRAIRNRRAEMNVAPGRKTKLTVVTQFTDTFNDDTGIFFKRLASASEIEVKSEYSDNDAIQIVTDSATFFIPLADMIDFEAERTRLNKERDQIISPTSRGAKRNLQTKDLSLRRLPMSLNPRKTSFRPQRISLRVSKRLLEKLKQ